MADKKISQLNNATTPLAGTEVLPIVQSSSTVKTTISDVRSGGVLQVVSANYSTATTSSSNAYADTGLTVTITPKFTTSKILVFVSQNGVYKNAVGSSFSSVNLRLVRGATELAVFGPGVAYTGTGIENNIGSCSLSYLDTPNTTSATSYKTQFASDQNVNAVSVQTNSAASSITVMEIAA